MEVNLLGRAEPDVALVQTL